MLYAHQALSILGEDKDLRSTEFATLEDREKEVRQILSKHRCKLIGDMFTAFGLLKDDKWKTSFPALEDFCPEGPLRYIALRHQRARRLPLL